MSFKNLVAAAAVVAVFGFANVDSANAGGLFGGCGGSGGGCCGPSVVWGACAPTSCDPCSCSSSSCGGGCGAKRGGFLKKLFAGCKSSGCAPAPSCGAPAPCAPTCGAPAPAPCAPSCGAPAPCEVVAPTCGAPAASCCGSKSFGGGGLLKKLFGGCSKSASCGGCAPSCGAPAPSCGAPAPCAAPSCGAPMFAEPSCGAPAPCGCG